LNQRDRIFWLRIQRKAYTLSPDVRRAFLAGVRKLAESLSADELAYLIESGGIEQILSQSFSEDAMERAFDEVRQSVRANTQAAARYFLRDVPRITMGFDTFNPHHIEAIRALETRVMQTLKDDVRGAVRAHVEAGLASGKHPKTIARGIRDVVGLAPHQEAWVRNFRDELERGDAKALQRVLRDRRFDKALAKGPLSKERIDRMVDAYRRRVIAHNAETNARTASLDAMKLGQRLAWEDAIAQGTVGADELVETWITVRDSRVRPEHVVMHGEQKPFSGVYSNGQKIPGESDFNCRCLSRVSVRRMAKVGV
jgi:hypothetical protein